jgi:hypothetical protein
MDPYSPLHTSTALDPALFTFGDNPIYPDDYLPAMARHSHLSGIQSSTHVRHQSVPAFPSPQKLDRSATQQQSSSRGLAKLTLVERLSREPVPSPVSDETVYASRPKSLSPIRFDEGSPRRTHSPRRSRMSLTIPPTKCATAPVSNSSPISSPLRSLSPAKHVSSGSLSEINLSPTRTGRDRALTSPSVSSLEEVSTLDDANATFLTLIAFQERRVVELREELARAESELDLLKQQWTRQQLKLTRSAHQEHVRQNSITKLEQQITNGSMETPRTDREDPSQFLVVGKRIAEDVRDGFFTIVEDFKALATNETSQTTPRQRGRSPTGHIREDVELGTVSEKVEPPLWYPTRSPPMKGTVSEESDGSETHDTADTWYLACLRILTFSSTRASSISSSTFKSLGLDPSTPTSSSSTMTRSPDPVVSPWAWTMASRILHESQRHATTLFTSVEKHLDSLAAGPELPLHPRRARRQPSERLRTETVQF